MSNALMSCLTASFLLFLLKLRLSLGSDEVPLLDRSPLDVVVELDRVREVEEVEEADEFPPPLRMRFIAEGQCKRAGMYATSAMVKGVTQGGDEVLQTGTGQGEWPLPFKNG